MISFSHLALQFGSRILFDDVNLNLLPGKRYGIVGANGAGKTSLLGLIAGSDQPTLGDIAISKHSNIGWLRQDQFLHENDRIIDVVIQGKKELWNAIQKQQRLYERTDQTDEVGYEIAELEEKIGHLGGYEAEALAKKLLTGLGIAEKNHEEKLKVLSGGFKLRVLLARTLFTKPDILLLDEPTNYLDIVAISWLERYLIHEFQGLLLFVSHDQDFLNNLSTNILDIDYGDIRLYHGGYDAYLVAKEASQDQLMQERDRLEAIVARKRLFIERFGAKATKAKQAKSREKQIEKLEWPDVKQSIRQKPMFNFKPPQRTGERVLLIKGLWKAFDEKIVLCDVTFNVHRHDKVAIIGANGVGKSTILKISVGDVQPDSGEHEWGHGVSYGYFPQDLHELVSGKYTALGWLESQAGGKTEQVLRSTLGKCLFSQDDVFKPLSALSGGEMARLAIAKLMLEHHNVLVLDEPTNHLDLEGRQGLADALKAFEGTVILVSHDRHFVEAVANRILNVQEESVEDFPGSMKEWQEQIISS